MPLPATAPPATAGTLVTLVRDRVVSGEIDPIEKKPFFHFLPGTLAYSICHTAIAGVWN